MVTVNCFLSEKEVFIVRKKSHILLARYLADQMPANESLQSHRKAFCLGNILPDIQPSFVTKRHEYLMRFRVRYDDWFSQGPDIMTGYSGGDPERSCII